MHCSTSQARQLPTSDDFSTVSEGILVNLFNTAPIGHNRRKYVLLEITRRRIPLLFETYGLVKHRNTTRSPVYYVLGVSGSIMITCNKLREKVTVGHIDSVSILCTDNSMRIAVHLLEHSTPETSQTLSPVKILGEVNVYNNTPCDTTRATLLRKFWSYEYATFYHTTIGIRLADGATRSIHKHTFRKTFPCMDKIKKIHAELLGTGLIKINIIPTQSFIIEPRKRTATP